MADEKKTGTTIVFKIDGQPVAGETGCGFAIGGDEIDISNKSTQHWKEFLAGRANWTARGAGILMFDEDTDTLEASQKALFTAITTRADVDVEIALTDDLVFEGTCFFTSYENDNPDNAPATLSWAVRGKGALQLSEGGS